MTEKTAHPMMKLQRKVASLIAADVLKPNDSIWKVAFLYGEQWSFWKSELLDFGFTMQDPVQALLAVEEWDED